MRLSILTLLFSYELAFNCKGANIYAYTIPDVKVDLLSNGFRASIPDEVGIERVAFNVNLNRPFQSFQPGEYSVQLSRAINNRWSYETTYQLEPDDIIYIWTHVQHNKLIFRAIAKPISVEQLRHHNTDTDVSSNNDDDNGNGAVTTVNNSNLPNNNCESAITVMQNRKICKGQLVFEENFNGNQLNTDVWTQEARLPLDVGDAEFVLYDLNAKLSDGFLSITPFLWNNDIPGTNIMTGELDLTARCTGTQDRTKECKRNPAGLVHNVLPPIVSARVNTKSSFSFKYGRVEIRAKLPKGDWLFPQLLLEPLNHYYGQKNYTSGQMRIAFARGNQLLHDKQNNQIDGRTLYGGAVLMPSSSFRDKSMVKLQQLKHFGDEFHVYTLIWTNEKLVLQVDGREYGTVQGGFQDAYAFDMDRANVWKVGQYMAPLDQEFYITLGVAAGGHADFPDDSESTYKKPWTNTSPKAAYKFWQKRSTWKAKWTNPELKVDYVRVYAI